MKMLKQALNLLNISYYVLTFKYSMSYERTYQDVTGLFETCQRVNMFLFVCLFL